ncbi:P-type conjugative transfer protein TrbJ [Desulfovibrio desulfuricans]|uniref:P-type conjugative transfer protein TrbJ n=1 Tax=Desulfovibrio desulfuricans TaxID=876 RepID=UPI001AA22424|nr:P-type conjugative transfer protein TrbJ [Desulfovibrio desulfuricans]QTO41279.1 P-type conjugative transfer protein TrbJ [Desulfovibrio desulfuricans]CAI3228520.1 Conjugative transfer protein TrbJ [Desulfovibrio diazotrophicus]VVU43195.1 Conjugative transfer protein TrbJ [Desulfovibrio diazotrophicus]
MKKYLLSLAMLVMLASPAQAFVVTCTNCSNMLVQMLDRITNMEELATLMNDYQESITQTAQQIRMVQQNIEQYQNMIQNTVQLPANLVNELKGSLTRLSLLTNKLKTQRGDIVALGEVFNSLFPELGFLGGLASSTPERVAEANAKYRAQWDKWAESVDQASQATFQLSGHQLEELQKDAGRFDQYLDELLSTPDGQQKAIMAGNQLSALQVQEARQLRELMATQVQSSLASQMKAEKESQMAQEAWRDTLKTNKIGKGQAKPDPF